MKRPLFTLLPVSVLLFCLFSAYSPAPAADQPDPELVAEGKILFQTKICYTCHQTDINVPVPVGLALKSPSFTGDFWGKEREVQLDANPDEIGFQDSGKTEKVKLDDAYFLESVEKPFARIVKGAIPGMAPLPTTPEERIALLAYVKSLSKEAEASPTGGGPSPEPGMSSPETLAPSPPPPAEATSAFSTVGAPTPVAAMMQKGLCVACHQTVTKLVGPSWKDIALRYEGQDVLSELVRKAKSGGQGVWGEIPMPPNVFLSESDIEPIVKWVLASAAEAEADLSIAAEPARMATAEDVSLGQDLFQGSVRFENRGATCNSCHDVQNDAVIGGGILAKELTSVISRLGGPGVRAILGTPPFPVMQQAYKGKPLTEDEVFSLVAFLEEADAQSQFQHPRDYGFRLFFTGVMGASALFGVCGVTWRDRKRQSVYQEIFDRQTKSM